MQCASAALPAAAADGFGFDFELPPSGEHAVKKTTAASIPKRRFTGVTVPVANLFV